MKYFKEFKITTFPFDVETVSGFLWQLDIDGITEFDNYLDIYVNNAKNISENDIRNILQNLVSEKFIESFEIRENVLEDKNWNEEFEKKINVIEVTDKIVIKPSFKEYTAKPGQIIVTIDPKMSFGTGEHATTKLLIKLLEKYISGGETVLDVGSGTGILGIISVMLGAKNALCIDNDEWCLLNGKENVQANNLEEKVEICLGELKDITENDFDLIVANINKLILIDIGNELKVKLKETGTLMLSGLLASDENDIRKNYEILNFTVLEKFELDEWIALVLKLKL